MFIIHLKVILTQFNILYILLKGFNIMILYLLTTLLTWSYPKCYLSWLDLKFVFEKRIPERLNKRIENES